MAETSIIEPQRGRRVGKLTLLTDTDALEARPREYLLKGLISPSELSVIYGEPGCGKSFFALYLARAVSQGRQVLGKRIHQSNVLFLALEGVSGFEKRLRAQIMDYQESEGFGYIAQPVDLFADNTARDDVIEAAQIMSAGIIVVDTLNRAMGGGSENDPSDMGQFIKNLDHIRISTGAHICVIHHCGKDSTRGMRGHSSLLGASDVVMEVKREEGSTNRTVSVHKAKDDADDGKYRFALKVRELGVDEDGDPITTCVVEELELTDDDINTGSGDRPLSKTEKLWLRELQEFFSRDGNTQLIRPEVSFEGKIPCATRDDVREWCKARGLVGVAHSVARPGVLSSTDRSKFSRGLEALKIRNKIGIHGNWIWLVQ